MDITIKAIEVTNKEGAIMTAGVVAASPDMKSYDLTGKQPIESDKETLVSALLCADDEVQDIAIEATENGAYINGNWHEASEMSRWVEEHRAQRQAEIRNSAEKS